MSEASLHKSTEDRASAPAPGLDAPVLSESTLGARGLGACCLRGLLAPEEGIEAAQETGELPSARAFAWFRIGLGLYLAQRFLSLIPYAGEVFSREGTVPAAALNFTAGILPSPLTRWDEPWQVQAFLGALALCALLFACGVGRRACALLLVYGAACLFNRNNLISNPSLPYVGSLLLLSVTVPLGEGLSPLRAPPAPWFFPRWTSRAAWILLALGYSFSGLDKLWTSPSWRSGEALRLVLELPLARPGAVRELLLSLPDPLLRLMTWGSLATEILCLPLWIWARTRRWAWLAATSLQLGILLTLGFAELTCGMLLVHWFVFDPRWLRAARTWLARARPGIREVARASST